ncbi:T9SS type A sorting domain-containing protein [Winogradskyella thalassocola]|uniref:Por secretion system C-terminal sorting domain-containing protein n=1 Tax=Winogradskyella thalassocola TaxID=262004 RepID=A0A1G8L6B8_9FLAO|nr:T9SS type A sorting domain-containing protein [Winogradskyella thalassocola]SDI51145.1 Por secretion system C-terminal sorting domain-containing protein [Winogradskyella thalassocola]
MKPIKLANACLSRLSPRPFLLFGVLISSFNYMEAQETIVTAGGDITDTGGTVNYSVGQVVQNTIINADTSVFQGIQFYFEDQSLTVVDIKTNLEITTYPNPTSSKLNINIDDFKPNTLTYKLYNVLGQLVTEGNVATKTTTINVNHLEMATYLLLIENTIDQTTQIFKIVKN